MLLLAFLYIMSVHLLCRIMEHKLSDIPLQSLMKSSDVEDEKAVAHDQAELREASQGDQKQQKEQNWLKRCASQKGKSVFIAVTTMIGYLLLYLAISVIAPFYSIWVSHLYQTQRGRGSLVTQSCLYYTLQDTLFL